MTFCISAEKGSESEEKGHILEGGQGQNKIDKLARLTVIWIIRE